MPNGVMDEIGNFILLRRDNEMLMIFHALWRYGNGTRKFYVTKAYKMVIQRSIWKLAKSQQC